MVALTYLKVCTSCAMAAANLNEHSIRSPRLEEIGNKHLEIQLPSSVSVSAAATSDDWRTIEADFVCSVRGVPNAPRQLVIQIIRWPVSRAERKGDLDGKPFVTKSGLSGVRTGNQMNDVGVLRCFNALTIINRNEGTAVFIKISPKPEVHVGSKACSVLENISTGIYDTVRFSK